MNTRRRTPFGQLDEIMTGRLVPSSLRHQLQEIRQLGVKKTLFRLRWELQQRVEPVLLDVGLLRRTRGLSSGLTLADPFPAIFEESAAVGNRCRQWISEHARAELQARADRLAEGHIFGFGHLFLDHGKPFDWHVAPLTEKRWPQAVHWRRTLALQQEIGDVKVTWEAARFPQLYHLARAAVFMPQQRAVYASLARQQIESFIADNPAPLGLHWASGQEIAFRLMAWTFAMHVFTELRQRPIADTIARAMVEGAAHIARHIDYARLAVYNNHLLSEALGLLLVGTLVPNAEQAQSWRQTGIEILTEQASRQFYADGGYIQQSHTYQRVALTDYFWAVRLLEATKRDVPQAWLAAIERSLNYLFAHQNDGDGALANYGCNDGAQPALLSSCDYVDFRPCLETAALLVGQRRRYALGPWSEEAAWYCGCGALGRAQAPARRKSATFETTGHHVLRSTALTFCAFRCGTVRDRFGQIDMLHVDYYWRGINVLVDGGTYHYNNAPSWHRHFTSARSHNTLTVDEHDQMVHYRQFKLLYPTRARLLSFQDDAGDAIEASGEHDGFARYPGGCVHRRALLLFGDWLLVVLDSVFGEGEHAIRLHWLAAPLAHRHDGDRGQLVLETELGELMVAVKRVDGRPARTRLALGDASRPEGWLSRYYAQKVPAPALIHEDQATVLPSQPWQRLTLVMPPGARVAATEREWIVVDDEARREAAFVTDAKGALVQRSRSSGRC